MDVHVSHSFSFEFKFLQISNHRKSRSALSNCHIPSYSLMFSEILRLDLKMYHVHFEA